MLRQAALSWLPGLQPDPAPQDPVLRPELLGGTRFATILADPPWRFETRSLGGRDRCPDALVTRNEQRRNQAERHYRTMTLDELRALPVADVAATDCVLLMWAVDPMLPDALDLARHWGFTYRTVAFYWAKRRRNNGAKNKRPHVKHRPYPMGTGYWTRANPEQCLLFTRGEPSRRPEATGVEKLMWTELSDDAWEKLFDTPRREHSRKPDEQYARIEALCHGPWLELFARARRPGWAVFGNQTDKFLIEGGSPCPTSTSRRTSSA